MNTAIYVGTYKKYNDGNLFGRWMNLSDFTDKDDFEEACLELHSDEDDPELMFQDWKGVPSSMISECSISEEVWPYLEALETYNESAVNAYCELFGKWDESDFEDRYQGKFDNWSRFAEENVDQLGYLDEMPEHLRYYFDYDAFARDLECSGDYAEEDGHFFSNN